MQISSLLVVVLCGLVSVCAASDKSQQSSSPQTAVNSFSSDLFNTSGIVRPNLFDLASSHGADRDHSRSDSAHDGDVTCYTIESYLVKRDSPHSDVTEPAGHSTCLPASKYRVKMVEEPGKAPSR
jgi:hypothetical protein